MKIEIERSGGLTGFINTLTLDTKTLPREIAQEIERHLIKKTSETVGIILKKKKNIKPDSYSYKISFRVGNQERKLEFNEFDDAGLVSLVNNLLKKKSNFK
jgi:hypothetical protein